MLHCTIQLAQAAKRPVDAILVLGGSIRREIAVAQQASRSQTSVPILISAGSPMPCTWSVFEREISSQQGPSQTDPRARTWLEPCANSTLGNYRFSLPVLKAWGAQHIQLVTSGNHQLRATGLGRIILGSHGIWLSPAPIAEIGRPGNRESALKTCVDWLRGLGWAVISQVYSPNCDGLVRLDQVVLEDWVKRDFACEQQGQIELPEILKRSTN